MVILIVTITDYSHIRVMHVMNVLHGRVVISRFVNDVVVVVVVVVTPILLSWWLMILKVAQSMGQFYLQGSCLCSEVDP